MFCELFGLSKQAFYKGRTRDHESASKTAEIKGAVLLLRHQMPRLGGRKLQYLLNSSSVNRKIGRDRLFKFLREESLLVSRKRKYTITTNSKHWLRKYPNIAKGINLIRPEQVWVSDITYIDTVEDGNVYLHLVTDAYSKRIMGYELCDNMEANSTLKALKMAVKARIYNDLPLLHHSDRGLQYCSRIYTGYLKENRISISMTENGDPYENAIAERINGILKDEFGLSEKFDNLKQAKQVANQSIAIYNEMRPHQSCRMLTPMQMHGQNKIRLITYKKKKFKQGLIV